MCQSLSSTDQWSLVLVPLYIAAQPCRDALHCIIRSGEGSMISLHSIHGGNGSTIAALPLTRCSVSICSEMNVMFLGFGSAGVGVDRAIWVLGGLLTVMLTAYR